MSESESQRKFAELNMTKDELNRFTEAMKKEEFRKLLVEYAEELSDPKNREQYEKEIAQLEEERGMNVTFIHPEKGFCMKTTQNGDLKCFINICQNSNIEKPTSKSDSKVQNGKVKNGLFWEIPHTCSPARDDLDHDKKKCIVYDVVFNPDSYRMGESNERFKDLLKSSAMDTIENSFHVRLDRVNAKVLKNVDFKGRPTACVIKKKVENFVADDGGNDPIKPLIEQIKEHQLDKQLDERLTSGKANTKKETTKPVADLNNNDVPSQTHTTPKYSIVHRGLPEMGDHANQLETGRINIDSTRPKEISISIELPLIKSSANVNLDVFETTLELSHEDPNYKLNLKLPYPVRETEAKAKFDKSKRSLNVTLPVIPYVANIEATTSTENAYTFPLSGESSNSNSSSSSSISDALLSQSPNSKSNSNSNSTNPNEQSLVNEISKKVLEDSSSKASSKSAKSTTTNKPKQSLPSKTVLSETKSFISFKFSVNNYVKDSIKVRILSDSTMNLTLESCSLSGCYIQYYSVFIELNSSRFHSELINEKARSISDFAEMKTVLLDFAGDSFVLKVKKSDEIGSAGAKTARISIDESRTDAQTVEIDQDLTESVVEQAQMNEAKVNNMSRKDYIMNFKEIISADGQAVADELDEDDDNENEEEGGDQVAKEDKKAATKNSPKHEKIKFEERKLAKLANSNSNSKPLQVKKIDEQPELEKLCNENNVEYESEHEDYERDYLQSQLNSQNDETNEENDADDDGEQKQNYGSGRSSSCSYDSSLLASSLNSTSSISQLKGILKKPRSFSESESSHSSMKQTKKMSKQNLADSLDSNVEVANELTSEENLSGSKKSVKFNNQVVRNMFKSNSTVQGMKKPNSNKNRKKNERKRTISDPSHDSSDKPESFNSKSNLARSRSISESTDDDTRSVTPQSANSLESINEEAKSATTANDGEGDKQELGQVPLSAPNKKKNKKKKKNGKKSGALTNSTSSTNELSSHVTSGESNDERKEVNLEESKNKFNVETMMEWKKQGLLPDDSQLNHGTECSFKFKNRIINDLDD